MIKVTSTRGEEFSFTQRVFDKFDESAWKYINRMGYSPYIDPETRVLITEGNCICQSWFNKAYVYPHLLLKVVYGSLGVGAEADKPAFFEFGNPSCHTFQELANLGMMARDPETGKMNVFDLHCWLEDEQGRIYDVATSIMHAVSIFQEREYHYGKDNHPLQAVTREEAKSKGLEYVPFPTEMQQVIAVMAERDLKDKYEALCAQFLS